MYTIDHEINTDSGVFSFPLKLRLLPVNDLYPHEKVVPSLLNRLKNEILEEEVLKDPIVVDEQSFTVLDGMHRLNVVKKLGLNYIPCCLVDYESNFIKLGTWCRKLSFPKLNMEEGIKEIKSFLDRNIQKIRSNNQIKEILQDERKKWDIIIVSSKGDTGFCGNFSNSNKIYWEFDEFEKKLEESSSLQINYEADKAVINKLNDKREKATFFLFPPLTMKETVLRYSKERKLLPPKTTRHVFPARPLAVDCPLSLLKGDDLKKRDNKFLEHLQKKEAREKKGETKIEGRYYDEKTLYVFQ